MKKVLFVLGLALCSTFAMAQTNKVANKLCTPQQATQKLAIAADKPVDYKGSIFTKDDDVVLGSFDFSAACMDNVTIDVVTTNDRIDGSWVLPAAAHGRTEPCFRWHRIPDSAYTHTTTFATDYSVFTQYVSVSALNRYMGVRNGITDDNGFMFISVSEEEEDNNPINTYFQLGAVTLQPNMVVADVTFRQFYRKYYDKCYIDYKKGNNWISNEVNVTGVDCEVTDVAPGYYRATLSSSALDQDSLILRFRITATGTLPYGYGWAVDDVKILIPGEAARWSFNSEGFCNGFYGTLPMGFQIPLAYTIFSRNTSRDSLYGNNLAVHHRYYDDASSAWGPWSEVFNVDQPGMGAGRPSRDYTFEINESGFMYSGHGFGEYKGYHSFPQYYDQYGATDAQVAAMGFQRRSLPTQETGKHQFCIIATNGNGLADTIDGLTYTVSEDMDADETVGRTIPGYRWGNDNGIVPGGREFAYGFTDDNPQTDRDDAGYVTSDCGHQYEPNYEVMTRYNTPSAIPTTNGEPWVIRGIEYVTSTKLVSGAVNGAIIVPQIYRYQLTSDTSGAFYNYINYTGLISGDGFRIGANSAPADEEDLLLYNTLEGGQYYCYNIAFPEQPALEPNVSFLLGYDLVGGGDFAVATTAYSYQNTDSTYLSYSADPDIADYYYQLSPINKPYDAYCYDPIQGSRNDTTAHTVSGWNIETYPMIRLIVGPKRTLPSYDVYLDCGAQEGEYWIYASGVNACDAHDTATEGSSRQYFVIPGFEDEMEMVSEGENSYYIVDTNSDFVPTKVIDRILVDGNPIDLTNEDMVEAVEYPCYWPGHTPDDADPWEPALVRYYYAIYLRDIHADHTISAVCHDETLSIRNIEDNINLKLAPNPATSQVSLNIAGFSGKANCSIIDMSGRVIYSADITAGESVISLNGVPAGAYFVRVTNDTFSKVEKLIVR